MNFGEKNPQHDFPKMRGGGGSTAVWNSENSSVFEGTGFPKCIDTINGIFMIFMPTGPCVRERGEYLKQKQMLAAQRLDGHGWSSAVLIIVSKYISSSSFLL